MSARQQREGADHGQSAPEYIQTDSDCIALLRDVDDDVLIEELRRRGFACARTRDLRRLLDLRITNVSEAARQFEELVWRLTGRPL